MVSVDRIWPGRTVVCIGGGPSLTQDDVRVACDHASVIAINNAYQLIPPAKTDVVLYACDDQWWGWHPDAMALPYLKYSLTAKKRPGVLTLQNTGQSGFEPKATGLRTGLNSGYQAINLAVHLGAAQILLLGYDMQRGHGPMGSHWHPPHPVTWQPPVERFLPEFKALVQPLAELGVAVINCSRSTALKCFPRQPLTDVLREAA